MSELSELPRRRAPSIEELYGIGDNPGENNKSTRIESVNTFIGSA
jgi:hypothetical protein